MPFCPNLIVLCLFCATLLAFQHRALYDTLGVKPTDDDETIAAAFKKLSRKYHPDKNRGDQKAHDKYVKITEAYDILSDPDKRHMYDMDGMDGVKKLERPQQGGGGDIFSQLFGGGGGGGGQQRTPDARAEMSVSLSELYMGAKKQISYQRNVICKKCRGTGAKGGKTKKCKKCKGSGRIMVQQQVMPGFNVQTQQTCPVCKGKGRMHAKKCGRCKGHGHHMETNTLEVEIERGMTDGQEIRFPRQAEQRPGLVPGDVIVTLKQDNHPFFVRHGNNLWTRVGITLKQSLLGFDLNIEHLDGRWINLQHYDITTHEQTRIYPKEGMPHHEVPSEFGKLDVQYEVELPKKVTAKQAEKLKEIFSDMSLVGEAV